MSAMMMEEENNLESKNGAMELLNGVGDRSLDISALGGLQLPPGQSKYAQLLSVIEEMGRDLRPTYAGSNSSKERLKRGIVHARILVRECLMETERSARQ